MSMPSTDPIADLLSRLATASKLNKTRITVPYSKLKLSLIGILKDQNYVTGARLLKADKPQIEIIFDPAHAKPIKGLRKVSKPGRRVYVPSRNIPIVRQGLGIAIMSTPQGMMLGHRAKARKLGGELICEVW